MGPQNSRDRFDNGNQHTFFHQMVPIRSSGPPVLISSPPLWVGYRGTLDVHYDRLICARYGSQRMDHFNDEKTLHGHDFGVSA